MGDYDRARAILKLYQACEKAAASPRASLPDGMPVSHTSGDAMTAMRAWKVDVAWAIHMATGSDLTGAVVLIHRLTRQQHSQANGWLTIAREVGLSKEMTELMFECTLEIFIRELDRWQIPDVYWTRPVASFNLPDRCAAHGHGQACAAGAA